MQQDWKLEIQQLFTDIKFKETELKSCEEELKRISIRQQAYESILRQREQAFEGREKELECIAKVETYKTKMDIMAPEAGVIEAFLVDDGSTIGPNQLVIKITTSVSKAPEP